MKTPRPFQSWAIDLGITRPLLLADECGLGKTLVGIEIAKQRMNDLGGPTLIVVPKTVRRQWYDELREQDPDRDVYVVETYTPVDKPRNAYYLTHYEVLTSEFAGASLRKYSWTTVIADEAHRIGNRNSQRTQALKKIPAHRRIALTGTPMEKSPANLWSLLHWLYPHYFNSYWKFCEKYVVFENVWRGKEVYKRIAGSKNLEELAYQLRYFTLQRTKLEVADQLPPKIETVVRIEMDPKQETLYKTLAQSDDLVVNVGAENDPLIVPSVLALITKLHQIASHPPLLGLDGASSKYDWLLDYLEDNPYEPIVVFTRFRGTAEFLHASIPDSVMLIGGTGPQPVSDFMEGRSNVLIGTIAAMGEGLNLQRARTAIFYDMEYSSVKMRQAIDRIHRMDITEPKNVLYLVNSPIDETIRKAFVHKMSEIDLVKEFLNERTNRGPI